VTGRILEAFAKMLENRHNSTVIALDSGRTKFLALALVDAEHLEKYLKRNNVPTPKAKEIVRNLTAPARENINGG
jgi:hypothetical protein